MSYLLIGGNRCAGAGAELPDGQADGQLLTWDAAAGAWLPHSDIVYDQWLYFLPNTTLELFTMTYQTVYAAYAYERPGYGRRNAFALVAILEPGTNSFFLNYDNGARFTIAYLGDKLRLHNQDMTTAREFHVRVMRMI